MQNIFTHYEAAIAKRVQHECAKFPDPSHDYLHVQRVVHLARKLAVEENANLDVVLPAAYLHDVVLISKQDERRSQASKLSADEAARFLRELGYAEGLIPQVAHAIHAHSFSANVKAETIEAKVVQDADRLDGLGAIGVARCFSLGGHFGTTFYASNDPFARTRTPDDKHQVVDHFFVKLLKLQERLQTEAGRKEGRLRTAFMQDFLRQLESEIA